MKEQTSAGPSGATFAHFIAGSTDPIVAVFHATMRNIPYRNGMSPSLWHHGTNVMLQKKKDNVRVDTLRAILLYEAALSANNKTLGREMMYYAEQLKVIAKEQYGSRWAHCSVDQVLTNRGITSDIVRQIKILSCYLFQ
jgi:predicted alpha/beta superfamily hydrolase